MQYNNIHLLFEQSGTFKNEFKKPTQFRFINLEPRMNLIFEPKIINSQLKKVCETRKKVERSMISYEYANRFIRTYILN